MDFKYKSTKYLAICTFSDVIVTITTFDKLESCHVEYFSKNAFDYVRTLVFVILLGVSLKFILNFIPPNVILIF